MTNHVNEMKTFEQLCEFWRIVSLMDNPKFEIKGNAIKVRGKLRVNTKEWRGTYGSVV